ncbi:Signal recognition particle subunit SRP68 [Choanephora cucurbitarum]|uniref:Signal recognition particle subunit SRP68 n=1 Tax=Choanephora cucurbitarum TaxID=101091 RepID=A0A1C7NBS7_9FUNG|nr:Signal recognition particle subunit SRP68 [Choanephora cucurbitarum]
MVVDVLKLINESRMTYGLRHQDYQRYREYSTNRVRRLRQILKLAQANSKSTNARKALPETFHDARYLHLFVYESERAWAFAMELKHASTNSIDTRPQHHLIKRLKRASQYAEQLHQHCQQQSVDDRTLLDAKAYASSMKGYLLFEQQQWKEALDLFIQSRMIYARFAQIAHAEQEALCYAAMDELDPTIRFCAYRLQLDQDVEKLVDQHPLDKSVQDQLDALSVESSQKNSPVQWREKTVTIKYPGLAETIQEAQQSNSWTEAEKLVKKAVKEDKEATAKVTSSKSAKATEALQYVFTFVEYHVFGSQIKHHLSTISNQSLKPQQRIQLYDNILKNITYFWDLPLVREDMALDGEMNVLDLYYKGCRCVHVAAAYNEMKKTLESLALYQKAQSYVVQAKQALAQIHQFADDALLKVTDQDLSELEQSIQAGTWKSRAAWYLEHGEDEQELAEQLNAVDLDQALLIDQLDHYPSHISPQRLVDLPPKFQPVACKPFYFDLAANFVKYPEEAIADRAGKSSQSTGGFWGIFGGRK